MHRTLTLLSAITTLVSLKAQPTLTFASNAPVPSTTLLMFRGEYMGPGPGGANVTWDMSGLVQNALFEVERVAPSATPNGASFPGSTVAYIANDVVMYFEAASEGVFQVGSDDTQGTLINYSDKGLYLKFPCTYQTAWEDEAFSSFDADGFTIERSISITGVADGYGTLIMPTGTVENVLRVHWEENIIDDSGFFTFQTHNSSHLYYVAGNPFPILQLVSSTMDFMGTIMTEQFSHWNGDISTGGMASERTIPSPLVFPNPARDRFLVQLPQGEISSISLIDMSGRVTYSQVGTLGVSHTIDIQNMVRGAYVLTVVTSTGDRSHQRVVIN